MIDLNGLLNHAAECLPEGWVVELSVEKDSGGIDLRYNGEYMESNDPEETLEHELKALINYAISNQRM